jgi:hypothetical protein
MMVSPKFREYDNYQTINNPKNEIKKDSGDQ